jgi:hypothetical protein
MIETTGGAAPQAAAPPGGLSHPGVFGQDGTLI